VAALDAQSGVLADGRKKILQSNLDEYEGWGKSIHQRNQLTGYNDSGGASRFFFQVQGEGKSVEVPQQLKDYLVKLISPPERFGKAVVVDLAHLDSIGDVPDNSLPGVIALGEPTPEQSTELLRMLRPGAHLLIIPPDEVMGYVGACNVEDAGFEIRDTILWVREAGHIHYVPKAARSEREAGCEKLPARSGAEAVDREEGSAGMNSPRAGSCRTANDIHNFHPCLHPDSLVMTERGYRKISEIGVSDRVYAADGKFHRVIDVSQHPYTSSNLYKLSVAGTNLSTLASDNHPFLIWKPERSGPAITGGGAAWVEAQDIEKGDYTMTPILAEDVTVNEWAGDHDFWFIFGLYLAEGSIQRFRDGSCVPSFSLHRLETELVNRIKAYYEPKGVRVSVYPKDGNSIQVMAFDRVCSPIFDQLGKHGAATKSLDPVVWGLGLEDRRALVEGYFAGGGYEIKGRIGKLVKSVSPDMSSQMFLLTESLGGCHSTLDLHPAKPGRIKDREFKSTKPFYWITCAYRNSSLKGRRPSRPTVAEYKGSQYTLRYVKSVEQVPYTGDVWNLTVEGSSTFQTVVGMSHNTAKPIRIMERLLTDVPVTDLPVLDPFVGSGATGIACVKTGHPFIGIDNEKDYLRIADARIRHWAGKERGWLIPLEMESDVAEESEEVLQKEETLDDIFGWGTDEE